MKARIFYIFLFLFFFHFFIPAASAQQSKAVCTLSVSVSGYNITVLGSVTESKPGLDPSETYMVLSDDAGGPGKTSSGQDSITDSYSFIALPGTYRANIEGQSWSNPGGGTSTCNDFEFFTVGSQQWLLNVSINGDGYVYSSNVGGIDCGGDCSQYYDEGTWVTLEADPSSGSNFNGWGGECSGTGSCTFQMGGNRYVTANFSTNAPPAPGGFSITGGACYGWPNVQVETNFNPSSGATSYTLQKWFTYYYGDIASGSYQDIDNYGDPNVSNGNTYWYRVVAHNSSGSTVSNNEHSIFVSQANCGGGAITLNVYKGGTGSGTVAGGAISCGTSCSSTSATYNYGDPVTLNATEATGSSFAGWSGACAGTSSCSLSMTESKSVTATFNLNSYTLSTSIASGVGTISGSGINCPASVCSTSFNYGNWAIITANDSDGYTFSSWNGACSTQPTRNCSLYMDGSKSTSANFSTNAYTLSVAKAGTGTGTVTSSPGGISCGSQCSNNFNYNTSVILTATPSTGSSFAGWSGACSNAVGNCTVTMSAAKSVTATFSTDSHTLTVSKSGTGTGTVSANTGAVSCGATCSGSYTYGTSVTLSAYASSGSEFVSWSGCTSTNNNECIVSMTQARSVTATFNLIPFNYSLSNSGTSNVQKTSGNAFTQNTVTKTYLAGTTQSVSLTLSGVPSATTYALSNGTCAPSCSTTITFTVGPTAPVGTHQITVTGSPLGKTTAFNLVVTGSPITVACSVTPATVFLGESVTWSATVSGGRAPLTYAWSGSAIPTSPAPNTNPYSRSYSTIGQKTGVMTVTDADGTVSSCPAAIVQVNFDPEFEEF